MKNYKYCKTAQEACIGHLDRLFWTATDPSQSDEVRVFCQKALGSLCSLAFSYYDGIVPFLAPEPEDSDLPF